MVIQSLLLIAVLVGVINGASAVTIAVISLYQSVAGARPACDAAYDNFAPNLDTPFVSVHVATHNEPPAMVIDTLNALSNLEYPNFEVIVIDNNTVDQRLWQPVADHMTHLGDRFRFVHADGVTGAKAGALNIALKMTDPQAHYIAIVDADYQVTPDFLSFATASCADGLDFVQFPQSYRKSEGAEAVCSELRDYFAIFPAAANRTGASLLTGTLSLISAASLRRVGGWPTGSITEDAELGVTLWRAGARGRYIDRVVGNGLLPLDLAGLRQQRKRWAAGNVQTLLYSVVGKGAILRPGVAAIIAQLTAWTNFLAVPLATLVLIAGLRLAGIADHALMAAAQLIAVATIGLTLVTIAARAFASGRGGALSATMAMIWTNSFGWLPALFGRQLIFHRTPKAIENQAFGAPSVETVASLIALTIAAFFALEGAWLTSAIVALSASGLLAGFKVNHDLKRAARAPECTA